MWKIEIIILALIVIALIFEVIMPIIRSEPLFPTFRRTDDIDHEIEEARHAKEEAEKEAELLRIEVETARINELNKEMSKSVGNKETQNETQTKNEHANVNKTNS
jgi:hypothetical protein